MKKDLKEEKLLKIFENQFGANITLSPKAIEVFKGEVDNLKPEYKEQHYHKKFPKEKNKHALNFNEMFNVLIFIKYYNNENYLLFKRKNGDVFVLVYFRKKSNGIYFYIDLEEVTSFSEENIDSDARFYYRK